MARSSTAGYGITVSTRLDRDSLVGCKTGYLEPMASNPTYDFSGQVALVTCAGSTWRSTTPGSRSRPAMPPTNSPRCSTGSTRSTCAVCGSDAVVRQQFPVITQALELSASAQLRNMASIGGNLMQRPRCLYIRDVSAPCNRLTPDAGCGAISGRNRTNAIFGTSDQCVAKRHRQRRLQRHRKTHQGSADHHRKTAVTNLKGRA
jgi:hypothetical protein